MERDYKVPTGFEDYMYVNQLNQAEGIKMALEAHRRAKPYCMGTLYWQLNDCWPVISWSSVDYYDRWKPLHYFVRKVFDDVLISPLIEDGMIRVYINSDKQNDIDAKLKITLYDFKGKGLWSEQKSVNIPKNSCTIFWENDSSSFLRDADMGKLLLKTELVVNEEDRYDNLLFFVPVKDLDLEEAKHTLRVLDPQGVILQLQTDVFTKNIQLTLPAECEGRFSDNYFDLLPGQMKEIGIENCNCTEDQLQSISIKSLNNIDYK